MSARGRDRVGDTAYLRLHVSQQEGQPPALSGHTVCERVCRLEDAE